MTPIVHATMRSLDSSPISIHSSSKVEDPRSIVVSSRSNEAENHHSIEKRKNQRQKLDPMKGAARGSPSSQSLSFKEDTLTKKRKIAAVFSTTSRDLSKDYSEGRRKIRDDALSDGEKKCQGLPKFLKSDPKPIRSGDNVKCSEKPKHAFTVQNRKDAPYLEFIRQGTKKAECRVNAPIFRKIKVGDTIQFHNRHEGILCRVTYLHKYNNFREMVIGEGVKNILPHIYRETVEAEQLIDRAVKIYEAFPGSERVKEFGSIAIGVTYLRDYFKGR